MTEMQIITHHVQVRTQDRLLRPLLLPGERAARWPLYAVLLAAVVAALAGLS